jgi:hypothetical protein
MSTRDLIEEGKERRDRRIRNGRADLICDEQTQTHQFLGPAGPGDLENVYEEYSSSSALDQLVLGYIGTIPPVVPTSAPHAG